MKHWESFVLADHRDAYKLLPKPIGRGGFAEVFKAQNRVTGAIVALKRRLNSSAPLADRMRREIQVQRELGHPHVMPILDFDPDDYAWFTMPLAARSLQEVVAPVDTATLVDIVHQVAKGLLVAHESGHVHRDIKPQNILYFDSAPRWVVADWGIVRRPEGLTTAEHTHTGMLLGTEGFAPPEAYSAPHSAGKPWDIYSLGRLTAWASTGVWPQPLAHLQAPEPWTRFVRVLTHPNSSKRPQNLSVVLELLTHVSSDLAPVTRVDRDLVKLAKSGDPDATMAVLTSAADHLDDEDLFIDDIAELTGPGLDAFVRSDAEAAAELLAAMERHLRDASWYNRSFDHYNVPLYWMQRVAQAAADAESFDLLEDACATLFDGEVRLDRWRQTERTREWLASLTGPPAAKVARVLRENPDACRRYGPLKHARDGAIRAVLMQ